MAMSRERKNILEISHKEKLERRYSKQLLEEKMRNLLETLRRERKKGNADEPLSPQRGQM